MAESSESLLARLARGEAEGTSAFSVVSAQTPTHQARVESAGAIGHQDKLDHLLGRIAKLTHGQEGNTVVRTNIKRPDTATEAAFPGRRGQDDHYGEAFFPVEPTSFQDASLTESEVEELALKFLLSRGDASGRDIADQVKLPYVLLDELLRAMKNEQLVFHRGSAPMNDYQFALTDKGRERARRLVEHCTYFGAAPVALADYIESVGAQSLTMQHPTVDDLHRAFSDLLINQRMLARLGPAINSGRGLFLYGAAGNGKTSIAERVTKAFGQFIWIPRAIGIDGEILRLFDPSNHEEAPLENAGGLIDARKLTSAGFACAGRRS